MASYHEELREHTVEDAEGNLTTDSTRIVKSIKKNEEPDYIKLYTKMWLEFNGVPEKWRTLFLVLACRMSYASLGRYNGGQIVYTIGTSGKEIMEECGWKTKDPLYKGLKELCKCNAIRQIGRGEYQINPQYAGRGPWHYNAKEQHGGVADLIAQFNFAKGTVDTQITWASTDKEAIGSADEITATRTKTTPDTPSEATA